MKCIPNIAAVLLSVAVALHAAVDSSSIIFDDTRIHRYELQFYCTDWEDSLVYYKTAADEQYMPARLLYRLSDGDSVVLDSVGVRYKGNSSYAFAGSSPKKPYKFKFDKYVDDRSFFGVKRLNFSNGAKDPTMMREKISYDILSHYMPAPRSAFATISIEGELIGLYTQVEQVSKTFLSRHFSDNDGNLFKSSDNGSTLLFRGPNQSEYEEEYSLKTNESENDWSSFVMMLYYLNTADSAAFINMAGNVITLDNVCRYLAFNMVFSNFDGYTGSGRNFYLYDDPSTDKFSLIPWDLNLSFGAFTNSWNVYTNDVIAVENLEERPLNKRIIENDSLRKIYLRYIRELVDGPATPDSIAERAEIIKQLIDSTVQADPNKLHTYDDFLKNIDTTVSVADGIVRSSIPGLKSFCVQRGEALRSQLDEYLPVVKQYTGTLKSSALLIRRIHVAGKRVSVSFSNSISGKTLDVELFNSMGRKLRSSLKIAEANGNTGASCHFDISCSGFYFLKIVSSSGEVVTRSFIVGE